MKMRKVVQLKMRKVVHLLGIQQGKCTPYSNKQGMTGSARGIGDITRDLTCDAIVTQIRPPLLHLPLEGQAVGVRAGEEVQHSCVVIQHVH